MNTKKRIPTILFVATTTLVCFAAEALLADPPNTEIEMIVTSASGAQRHTVSYDQHVGRIGLRPGQIVGITIQFSTDHVGSKVSFSSFDGGVITSNSNSSIAVEEDGTATFQFQGGYTSGLYRVRAHVGETDYELEFYVLDTVRLSNNPPRVQIVD